MKLQALIEILFILLSRKKVTAKYLADRLNVSIRSVYRYVDELSICVPIYNTRGRNGGFAISETYKIPSSFFTATESEFLINILNSMGSEINSPTLVKIIEKIKSISKSNNADATLNFGNLIIDGSAWGEIEGYKEIVTFLERHIENKTTVLLGYRNREGVLSEREVEPHVLILKQGLWYLYGYCYQRQDFRLFKIGRIEKAISGTKQFEKREIDNLKELLKSWYDALSVESIELEINPSVKAEIEEWLGVERVYTSQSGKIMASANAPVDKVLAGKILSFGDKVKVISPPALIKEVISLSNQIAKLYIK